MTFLSSWKSILESFGTVEAMFRSNSAMLLKLFQSQMQTTVAYKLPWSKLTLSKLDPVHYWATSVFYFVWASNGKGSYFCPTGKWDSDRGPRRETCRSWGHPKGHQRGEVSRVETLIHWKTKEGFEHWVRMWKERQKKKRDGFGAGEEGSEGGRKWGSISGVWVSRLPWCSHMVQATHRAQKLLSADHSK